MGLTLSDVRQWDTAHLTSASYHWAAVARHWSDDFAQLEQATYMPGGVEWEGVAARAAQARAHTDRRRVSAVADQLFTASSVASAAAAQLQSAQQRILAVVDAAEAAGFTVGQDFSLTTYRAGAREIAAAEAQARTFGRQLRSGIEDLLELDRRAAERISAAADGIGALDFGDDNEKGTTGDSEIRAVENRILKGAPPPPPPPPPDPIPGRLPPVNGADDVKRVLDPLQNGGRRGPNGVGVNPGVKEIWDEASTRRLWDYLSRNAVEGERPSGYKGTVRVLLDGTRIGFRKSDGWGDTIDVWYPTEGVKTHTPYEPYFPPFISEPPQLPPPAGMPSVQVVPPQLTHPPTALPPAGIFEPNGLPPWLQNPSAPGFHTPVQPPAIMPGVALPDVADPSPPTQIDSPGPSVMGDAFVDASQAVGSVIVGGAVVIGGLLATVASPSSLAPGH